jgi:hypothetical protein
MKSEENNRNILDMTTSNRTEIPIGLSTERKSKKLLLHLSALSIQNHVIMHTIKCLLQLII